MIHFLTNSIGIQHKNLTQKIIKSLDQLAELKYNNVLWNIEFVHTKAVHFTCWWIWLLDYISNLDDDDLISGSIFKLLIQKDFIWC